jgi:formylglycine-generating enzyme required for sulfatase activity
MKAWKQRAFAAIATIIICGFFFTGCSEGNEASVANVAVTGVTLDNSTLSIVGGENKILTATVQPANATNKNIIWANSDPTVAIVSEGIVYAIGEGTATITATTQDGRKTATCTVTVTGNIPITGVELEKALFLVVEKSQLLTPRFFPANATNKNVTWLSYNPAVARVSNGGMVTAVASGTTTITVTTDSGRFEAECAVTVVTDIPLPDGMVWISPGTFMMGSPWYEPESIENETLHQVTLTEGFFMGKYPVTQAQYEAVMGVNDSYYPDGNNFNRYADRWEEFPVDRITWHKALVYCNKRSLDEGLSPAYTMYKNTAPNAHSATPDNVWNDIPGNWSVYPDDWGVIPVYNPSAGDAPRWNRVRMVPFATGYRLPTEAQWEYACRAGTTTPFNTGNNITTDQANWDGAYPYNSGGEYDRNGVRLGQTIPVGMYAPNAWGLYDMHGNIFEWCWDWYSGNRIEMKAETDPKGPNTGIYRILRGGSFNSDGKNVRSAFREWHVPTTGYVYYGFRVVRSYSVPAVIGE